MQGKTAIVNAGGGFMYVAGVRMAAWLGSYGTDAKIEIFRGLSHGFGLGQNTVAEGWLDHAVNFWKRNMRISSK